MKYYVITLSIIFILLTGCSAYQDSFRQPPEKQIGHLITISDYRFNPQTITIRTGEVLTWKNLDRDAHSISVNEQESPLLTKGQTFSITMTQPGTHEYYSGNHPFMKGTIIVQ